MLKDRTLLASALMIPVVGLLALAGVFYDAHPALAQTQQDCPLPAGETPPEVVVTAQQVEDGSATLREFGLATRNLFIQGAGSRAMQLYVGCIMRQDGSDFHSGSTYLVQLTPDGRVFVHSKNMALSGRLLNRLIYAAILQALGIGLDDLQNPAAITAAFTEAAGRDGGEFNVPRIPGASGYAAVYFSKNFNLPMVLLAGFDLNESHLAEEEFDFRIPTVTARDVVDRETLKAFVTNVGELFLAQQDGGDPAGTSKGRVALRDPNGPYRHGSVYIYILDLTSDIILVHGAFPDRYELRPLIATVRDVVTGELVLPQVIEAAKSSPDGGFVEYYFDDPNDDTDSADIPKVGYARQFTGERVRADGTVLPVNFIVGSGFYVRVADEVAAADVKDAETLKAFVDGAAAWSATFTDPNDFPSYIATISTEGHWKHGNTYLILMLPNGAVIYHTDDPTVNGKSLYEAEDARGNKVVQQLLAAADMGGGIVEYYWDDPEQEGDEETAKIAYAASYLSGTTGTAVVLIGGYYQDPSQAVSATFDPSIIVPPEVTAADVVDRETLKAFVEGSKESYSNALEQFGADELLQHQDIFRQEGGPWRQGSIYFFLFTTDGHVIFHGADRARELRDATLWEDINGVKVAQELIKVAKAGGGYVEYYFDDPAVTGDEDLGSPKVGYAELLTYQGREYVLGAGFYTGDADIARRTVTRTEVEATVLGDAVQGLALEFSRATSGRQANYAWNAFTDANGQVSLTISSTRLVSGYYRARARNAAGQVVGQWNSIPLNQNRRQVLELTLGAGMRVVRVEQLAAAKAVAATSGLARNVPNPFNSSTQIPYHLSNSGPVRLVIYNVLGQPVRTLVDQFQAAGSYKVRWDARDQEGASLSSGVYFTRLSYPGGVQTRRLLYLK